MFLCNARTQLGVAEHGDHVETIQKEMEQIAHYEDIKDVVKVNIFPIIQTELH